MALLAYSCWLWSDHRITCFPDQRFPVWGSGMPQVVPKINLWDCEPIGV